MKLIAIAFAVSLLFPTLPSSVAYGAADADTLLKQADDVRNPSETYKMMIKVTTSATDQEFEVFLKGRDKTLVVVKSPVKDRGRNMLMLDRDFQAYIPNLKKAVRKPIIERTEGSNTVLFLDGLKPMLTYQKLRLWVDSKSARPQRAEFLGLDGKTVLKRVSIDSVGVRIGRQPIRWSQSWTLPSLDIFSGRRSNRLFLDPLIDQFTTHSGFLDRPSSSRAEPFTACDLSTQVGG